MSLSASAPPPPPSDAPSLPLGDSAPAIPVSSLLNVDQTIGAMSIGFSLSCLLFGVLSTQVFIYFRRYPHDMYGYKAFVVGIWMLELIGQVLIGHAVYYYTISHFAEPLVFITGNVIWTLIVQIIFGDIVGSLVKACFALRVYRFSGRNWWVTGGIFVLIFGQFGLGIAYSQRSFVLNRLVFLPKLKTIATLALSANVATDATIALSLCFFLGKYRTGHRKSDTMVNKLTAYAINTGLLTSLISLATLLLYNLRPQTFEFMAMFFVYTPSPSCARSRRARSSAGAARTARRAATRATTTRAGRRPSLAARRRRTPCTRSATIIGRRACQGRRIRIRISSAPRSRSVYGKRYRWSPTSRWTNRRRFSSLSLPDQRQSVHLRAIIS
ncbi:hypothetical protein EV715DRAFT_246689, partial [Schizophyllum commune]